MNYKELIIWQKAHSLTLKTLNLPDCIKRSYSSDIIAKQLIRAVTSIGANIAEGYGRYEGKEYCRFLQISYGSANEVDNWLNVLKDSGMVQTETAMELIKDVDEIQRMLATTIKRIKEKGKDEKKK
jgi:four helix bundle protein